MLSLVNIVFLVAFILGGLAVYLLTKRNEKKLSIEQLEKIKHEPFTPKFGLVASLIIGFIVSGSMIIQEELGYKNLGFVILFCIVGVSLLRGRISKEIYFAKMQLRADYIRTDRHIASFASAFFIALGLINFIIFLRSEFY